MSRTYRAILSGNQLKWTGAAPQQSAPVPVDVTVLDTQPNGSRGRDMASALGQIASRGGITSIPNPEQWQREVRRDRCLPDRGQ